LYTIVSNETIVGDNWTVAVTPSDGYNDGTTVTSNGIKILFDPVHAELTKPINGNTTVTSPVLFVSNATDDQEVVNVTLYTNETGTFAPVETRWNGEINYNDTGLVGLYHFNDESAFGENSTKVYDWSKNGHNATVYGMPYFNASSKFGGAYQFDGIDDVANTAWNLSGTTEFTISAWINPKTHENYRTIWSMDSSVVGCTGDGLYLGFSTTYRVYFRVADVLNQANFASSYENTWVHLVAVYNSTNKIVYENGVPIISQSGGGATTGDVYLQIGDYNSCTGGTKFNGSIDEVSIWNRSLSDSEIAALYNYSRTKFYPVFQNRSYAPLTTITWNVLAVDNQSNIIFAPNNYTFSTTYVLDQYVNLLRPENNSVKYSPIEFVSAVTLNYTVANATLYTNESGWAPVETRWNGEVPNNMSRLRLLLHMNNESQFGENDTKVLDFSGNGINGTAVGKPVFNTTGKIGGAYYFNGSSYFDFGYNLDMQEHQGMTIMAWVKSDAWGVNGRGIIEKYGHLGNYYLVAYTSGSILFRMLNLTDDGASQGVSTTGALNTGQWYHIAASYDDVNTAKIYVDGVLNNSNTSLTMVRGYGNGRTLKVGYNYNNNAYWNGMIDEVAIFNRTLSDDEVADIYNTTRSQFYPTFQNRPYAPETNITWNVLAYDNLSQSSWAMNNYSFTIAPALQCGNLNTTNTIYTMTANASINGSTCFNVTAQNVTLNCNGYSITGNNVTSTYGIYSNQYNTTITNCNISNFHNAIYFDHADNGSIINAIASTTHYAGNDYGVFIYNSNWNKVINSIFESAMSAGLILYNAQYSTINNSQIYGYGPLASEQQSLFVYNQSNYNLFANNIIDGRGGNFAVRFSDYEPNIGNKFINNTFQNATTLVSLDSSDSNNTFILNNFASTTGVYVNDTNGSNYYNGTYAGLNQGNIYANVLNGSVHIAGTQLSSALGLYIGNTGSGYPYTNTTSLGKFSCNFAGCADYAPLTNSYYIFNITENLIGHWAFEENNGTVGAIILDDSANTNDGAITETTMPIIPGIVDKYGLYGFNDTGYVLVPYDSSMNKTSITISTWLYNNDTVGYTYAYIRKVNEWHIRESSGYWDFDGEGTWNPGGIYPNNYSFLNNQNKWHLHVLVIDMASKQVRFYVDGNQVGPNSLFTTATNPTTSDLYFGRYSTGYRWRGGMDDYRIYNYTLTSQDITELYGIYTAHRPIYAAFNGQTTDFTQVSNYTIKNISNVILENITHGLINWNGFVNATKADFDANVKIGYRYIYANSLNLDSSFNSSATIKFYNTGLVNALIYKDGVVCSDCSLVTHNGDNYTFNVTSFNEYTLGENLTSCSNLTSANTVYTMTANASINGSTCFNVAAQNVTLNCNGYSVVGNNTASTYGIYSTKYNTTIKNCNVQTFEQGIYYDDATNGTITGINVSVNTTASYPYANGILLGGNSDYNTITNIRANVTGTDNCGIFIWGGKYNTINNVTSYGTNGAYGLRLNANYNTISNSSTITQLVEGIEITAGNNQLIRNTFISADGTNNLLYIATTAGNNTFILNNFTSTTGVYVNDTNGSNYYNGTYDGLNQGNIWPNVLNGSVSVYGTVVSSVAGLYIGTSGSGYPYSTANSQGKLSGTITDYAPLTNQQNVAPVMNTSTILPSPAYRNESLRGYCNATDTENNDVTYYYKWFLNGVLNSLGSVGSYTQGITINVANISNSSLAVGDTWILQCTANDGILNSTELNSTTTTIQALMPETVTLKSPSNGNNTVRDRKPLMEWYTTNYTSRYEINITSSTGCGGNYYQNVTFPTLNFTPINELCVYTEGPNTLYKWNVRACGIDGCANWSNTWNFSIQPYVSINLINNSINFGQMGLGETKNTATGNPGPFVIQNDGNVAADLVNVSADQNIWSSVPLNNQYFQMKARQSNESGSFNVSGSMMNWVNISTSNQTVIRTLNYSDLNDSAYLDIQVTVPGAEPPGAKQTYVIFRWTETP
jgi:hypothetical protein